MENVGAATSGRGESKIPESGPADTIDVDTCQSAGLCHAPQRNDWKVRVALSCARQLPEQEFTTQT
jgi:hypothetical protein